MKTRLSCLQNIRKHFIWIYSYKVKGQNIHRNDKLQTQVKGKEDAPGEWDKLGTAVSLVLYFKKLGGWVEVYSGLEHFPSMQGSGFDPQHCKKNKKEKKKKPEVNII
jgi:hypothetical protein